MIAEWLLSSSLDRRALAVVDGLGRFAGHGPHYSRRTPGSRTFTGVGREVVLLTADGDAVWACVYQRTPSARGTGGSRGRSGESDAKPRFIWRNMMFRNLGGGAQFGTDHASHSGHIPRVGSQVWRAAQRAPAHRNRDLQCALKQPGLLLPGRRLGERPRCARKALPFCAARATRSV